MWLQQYATELKTVHTLFVTGKVSPKIDSNQPPIAGALAWCRGLKERAQEPYAKFRYYSANSNAALPPREEVKEIERLYTLLLQQLHEYERGKIQEWSAEVEASSEAKLQQPLLRRDKETRLLTVNFDSALVRLLREVKYFLLLKLDVAATALSIYSHAEEYRTQIGHLEQLVTMYNEMLRTLHPVERPLVEKEMSNIDTSTLR